METKHTLGQLPVRESCFKLMQVSFDTPKKNMQVYRFCKKVFPLLDFLQAEKDKLIRKYGDPTGNGTEYIIPQCRLEDYKCDMKALFSEEITEEIVLGLTEEDFDTCNYPKEDHLWLSAGEINTFLRF